MPSQINDQDSSGMAGRPNSTPAGRCEEVFASKPLPGDHWSWELVTPDRSYFLANKDRRRFPDQEVRHEHGGRTVHRVHSAWRNPGVADLEGFYPLVRQSVFQHISKKFNRGLELFQRRLMREISHDQLARNSELYRRCLPELARGKFRFFFTPAITADDIILITVFLEARVDELSRRPRNYRNANKHLHNSFFNSEGMMRKSPGEFQREGALAMSAEHTAYAKFYIRGLSYGKKTGISILIHPMQRARLAYSPKNDPVYQSFKERGRELGRALRVARARLAHSGSDWQNAIESLDAIVGSVDRLLNAAFTGAFPPVLDTEVSKIAASMRHLPRAPELALKRPSPARSCKRPVSSIQRELRAFLRTAIQVCHMYKKKQRGTEAEYHSANISTGKDRHRLFLGISEILRDSLRRSTGLRVCRYMLSSKEIETLRLRHERGGVRERIREVPSMLEKIRPIEVTTYPLCPRSGNGKISKKSKDYDIATIVLDPLK